MNTSSIFSGGSWISASPAVRRCCSVASRTHGGGSIRSRSRTISTHRPNHRVRHEAQAP